MMSALAEFVCRINYCMEEGSFELNMSGGIIQFKYYMNCMHITPPERIVEHSIMRPIDMFRQYSKGFARIIGGNYNARKAAEACETAYIVKILNDYKRETAYGAEDYYYDADEEICDGRRQSIY